MALETIEYLFSQTEFSKQFRLSVELLSPISMVSQLPGSYYRSDRLPGKLQLAGLFENVMGLHFPPQLRKQLFKTLVKAWKKQHKVELSPESSGSGYQPLVVHLFEMNHLHVIPSLESFDDTWKKAMRRDDAKTHPNGTPNLDYRLIPEKRRLAIKSGGPGAKIEDDDLTTLFKNNLDCFPLYYTTVSSREYLIPTNARGSSLERSYQLQLSCTSPFLEVLQKALEKVSTAYLGHSESWVELKIDTE
ncbi:type I-PGING CRISPR-associated protein Cas5p [Phaeodactylibacter luteus]|uniref:Type I-PGING CRISPR-associated protein Cas5p n=1 Tax=Phaeodactylibacter luteus TaxID=1564516 RepID=A0A5C6RN71_9BACT|nr:type I-PGING CRISPR-associated protein Cas5p [Phaeodactylibacter luteus]TXB62832.1 type I-PGING CRISPR-associated protein Cas5p [Phaeodactylibacter luteus]